MGRFLGRNRWRNSRSHLHKDHSRNLLHQENPIYRTWAKAWNYNTCPLFFQTFDTIRTYTKAYSSIAIIAVSNAAILFRFIDRPLREQRSNTLDMYNLGHEAGFPARFQSQHFQDSLQKKEEWLRFPSQHTPFFWSQQPMHMAGVTNLADFPAALLGGRQNLSLYGNP